MRQLFDTWGIRSELGYLILGVYPAVTSGGDACIQIKAFTAVDTIVLRTRALNETHCNRRCPWTLCSNTSLDHKVHFLELLDSVVDTSAAASRGPLGAAEGGPPSATMIVDTPPARPSMGLSSPMPADLAADFAAAGLTPAP